MTTAVQKITLASARDIPFNKLVLAQANVRRVKAGVSIEEMAESIVRRGLIQSLHVRAVLDAQGGETGMYEVPAGGRRFRALELLVKQKRLNKTAPVPCVISDASSGILIDELSLAATLAIGADGRAASRDVRPSRLLEQFVAAAPGGFA